MKHLRQLYAIAGAIGLMNVAPAWAQAVAGPEKARPVAGDPGISSMVVIEAAQFRVLRDYAEPGATRRMHAHKDATYQVFVLITGQLRLTIEGQAPVDVKPGETLSLQGGINHTFTNTGTVTATIVEIFGKATAPATGNVNVNVDIDTELPIASALAATSAQK